MSELHIILETLIKGQTNLCMRYGEQIYEDIPKRQTEALKQAVALEIVEAVKDKAFNLALIKAETEDQPLDSPLRDGLVRFVNKQIKILDQMKNIDQCTFVKGTRRIRCILPKGHEGGHIGPDEKSKSPE